LRRADDIWSREKLQAIGVARADCRSVGSG
jgi:hypothetical protein